MTPTETDAAARARAEVDLFFNKYRRRMKTRAVEIALTLLSKDPEGDPDSAGKLAAAQAGKELKLITRASQTAISTED